MQQELEANNRLQAEVIAEEMERRFNLALQVITLRKLKRLRTELARTGKTTCGIRRNTERTTGSGAAPSTCYIRYIVAKELKY